MEQQLDQRVRELEDKIQVTQSDTLLQIENKKEQLERAVDNKIETTRIQWSDLASDLASDDNNLTIAVDKRIENRMNTMTQELNSAQDLITNTRLQANEEREKERRRNNIVLYRVPESTANFLKDRTVDDTKLVLKFFNEGLYVGVDELDILKVTRLGRFSSIQSNTTDGGPPLIRPLLVSFNSYGIKNLIMNSLYKLKSSGHLFKSFIVSHDMTELERAQCKEKVHDAKLRSDADVSGEYRYVVRGQPGKMEVIPIRNRH